MKSLKTKHHLIMNRLLCGETQRQIALDMGLNETRLSIIVNSPLFKAELDRMQSAAKSKLIQTSNEVAEIINMEAPSAARRMCEMVDSSDEHVALKACEKVIEFSDFGRERLKEAAKPIHITQQQMMVFEEGMK